MQNRMRRPGITVVIAVALLSINTCALAQPRDFPSKPLRIVVPTSPGGILDLVARLLGQKMTELAGQTVIVENRAGASNNIGTNLSRARPPTVTPFFV